MESTPKVNKYWFEELPYGYNWHSLWYDYIICFNCGGITKEENKCSVCSDELPKGRNIKIKKDGQDHEIFSNTMAGAEGRYEDFVYLDMLESEWLRPDNEHDYFRGIYKDKRPAPKAIMVLVFWTYFETRIERLIMSAMVDIQKSIRNDLLKRYQSITSQTSDLYKVIFGKSNTYFTDLKMLGYDDISALLKKIQEKRNKFMHGEPEAIDSILIEDMVIMLKREHESWIDVFNFRRKMKNA